jgi:hypothetical protein
MSMIVSIKPARGYLQVEVSGAFDLVEAKRIFVRILESCTEHHLARALIDCSKMTVFGAMMDRYEFGRFVAEQQREFLASGRLTDSRVAFVGPDDAFDPGNLAETVALNRGAIGKITATVEEALAWLEVDADGIRQESGE